MILYPLFQQIMNHVRNIRPGQQRKFLLLPIASDNIQRVQSEIIGLYWTGSAVKGHRPLFSVPSRESRETGEVSKNVLPS